MFSDIQTRHKDFGMSSLRKIFALLLPALVFPALLWINISGCVPAPDRSTTQIIPAADLKITVEKNGKVNVSTSPETESDDENDATPENPEDAEE